MDVLRLLYLIFCQVMEWLVLLARRSATKNAELRIGEVGASSIAEGLDQRLGIPPRPMNFSRISCGLIPRRCKMSACLSVSA